MKLWLANRVVIKPSLAAIATSFAAIRAKPLLVVNGFIRDTSTTIAIAIVAALFASISSMGVCPIFSHSELSFDWNVESEEASSFLRHSSSEITDILSVSFHFDLHFVMHKGDDFSV